MQVYRELEALYAATAKERDELRVICDRQARMNRSTTEMALNMDALAGENNALKRRIEELEHELEVAESALSDKDSALAALEEIYAQEKARLKYEIAMMQADRDRLRTAYDAMARDLQRMSNRLNDARRDLAEAKAKTCDTCKHYNNSIGDEVCHACHGKNRWEGK